MSDLISMCQTLL